MPTITIQQTFKAPVAEVFATLCDHETFGQLIGAKIKRTTDGTDGHLNGVGSVRRIRLFPAPAFEETVVTYQPNQLMEYVISKGSPIKNHKGQMQFQEQNHQTRLDYTISFEPRWPLPLSGWLLKQAIGLPIKRGISKLAKRYA